MIWRKNQVKPTVDTAIAALAALEEDWPVRVSIPARSYILEKTGTSDETGIPFVEKVAVPFDAERVEITEGTAPGDGGGRAGSSGSSGSPSKCFAASKFALEAASGGSNTLLFDDIGAPSVMVRIPAFSWSDVIEGASDELCSAFIVGGEEKDSIYISKYLNVIENGRAYSLPARDPANTLNIDEARAACARKGKGWHLMTNAEWTAIAHWCRKNGHIPHGNNNFGSDVAHPHESGVRARGGFTIDDSRAERVLSGTGPDTWTHDGTPYGIYDLNGNIWDFVSGFRVIDGEIQVIPDNDSALNVDEGAGSSNWRAIAKDGSLVMPGSEGTYKYDGVRAGSVDKDAAVIPDGIRLSGRVEYPQYTCADETATLTNHDGAFSIMPFSEMPNDGTGKVPMILKQLGLYPLIKDEGKDLIFIRSYGERLPARGGSWFDGPHAGLWDLYLRDDRLYEYPDIGFRAAFIEL
jgi:hypothetical protein